MKQKGDWRVNQVAHHSSESSRFYLYSTHPIMLRRYQMQRPPRGWVRTTEDNAGIADLALQVIDARSGSSGTFRGATPFLWRHRHRDLPILEIFKRWLYRTQAFGFRWRQSLEQKLKINRL